MRVLGLDFETQGDDPKKTPITEIGARLVQSDTVCDLGSLSQIVYHPDYPPQTDKIVKLTGITDEMLKLQGILPREALLRLFRLMEDAEYIVAHNTSFDKTVLESACARMHLVPPARRWICSLTEVDWPDTLTCRKLGHLAYELWGVARLAKYLDGKATHRALTDVDLMLSLVFSQFTFTQVLAYADEPWQYLAVTIPPPWEDGGKAKDVVSKLGYSWQSNRRWGENAPIFEKRWVIRIKESRAADHCATLVFPWEKLRCPKTNG